MTRFILIYFSIFNFENVLRFSFDQINRIISNLRALMLILRWPLIEIVTHFKRMAVENSSLIHLKHPINILSN